MNKWPWRNRRSTYSQKLLADNKRQVEIGTLAPIEVVRAESEVATDQQNLIVAQTNVEQQGELIKTALAKKVDGDLVSAQVDAVDKLPEPRPDDIPPLDKALEIAAQNRPEIEQADLNLRYQDHCHQGESQCPAADPGFLRNLCQQRVVGRAADLWCLPRRLPSRCDGMRQPHHRRSP